MRLVFMGSGAFGLPTARALAAEHEIALVVSQPDRTAGRGRQLRPTPISEWALEGDLPLERPADVNETEVRERIRAQRADALVVIAFGQKLGPELLDGLEAFNLHASLLPAYRGAAPINRAMMDALDRTGVSVIGLAERMDAGLVFARSDLAIDPEETAGELHDRLAELGPAAVLGVLERLAEGGLEGETQDEALVSQARKLSRKEATVAFDQPAARIRARVHGLTPWPGCDIQYDGTRLRLLRVREAVAEASAPIGTIHPDGSIACSEGVLQLIEVQPAGKKPMSFDAWLRGHPLSPDSRAEAIT
jgi:methionyl-tRNA formyltransferase